MQRGGVWRGILWKAVRAAFEKKYPGTGAMVFDAALALSTEGKGGIFAIVDSLPDSILRKDRVDLARRGGNGAVEWPEWLF